MNFPGRLAGRYSGLHEPLRSERRLELALLVLLVLLLLAGALTALAAVYGRPIEPVAPAPDSLHVAQALYPETVAAEQSAVFQARPLFWPQRRPLELADSTRIAEVTGDGGAEDGPPAPPLQDLQLLGVFDNADDGGVIVARKQGPLRLLVGDQIDGWRLLSVSPNQAVFVSGRGRDVRELLPRAVAASPGSMPATARDPAVDDADRPAKPQGEARLSLGGRGD